MYTTDYMTTPTANNIITYLQTHSQATAKELGDFLGISRQALFRQLARLRGQGRIDKVGSSPKVFYFFKDTNVPDSTLQEDVDSLTKKIINDNYLIITPTGERLEGLAGFIYWCERTKQPLVKTAHEYVKTFKKYHVYKKGGLIDGTAKLKTTFPHSSLSKLFYLDFYSIERFGKTKLGQILLYGKQSQSRQLIKELIDDIRPAVARIVKKNHIDGIGFIPPTVKRQVQFMKELERHLRLGIPKVPIVKVATEIPVPQKTLSKLEDRIENARKTIIVDTKQHYKNILLIDDAVGSGATLNETAAQIKAKGICKGKIIGLAITGSFKGFDVISEV